MSATLTLERPQHEQAREFANEVRLEMAVYRAKFRGLSMHQGRQLAAALLEHPDEIVERMRLDYLLRSIPRVGRSHARRFAAAAGGKSPERRRIGSHRRKGELMPLTERQRYAVAAALREGLR